MKLLSFLLCLTAGAAAQQSASVDGAYYEIKLPGSPRPVLKAQVGAQVDHRALHAGDYPRHTVEESTFEDELGKGRSTSVTHTGLDGAPDLVCVLRVYAARPFGDIEVRVRNVLRKPVTVQSIRIVETAGAPPVYLGGPATALRVLADNFSESRPQLADLSNPPRFGFRGFSSELIYNRESKESLFLGDVTSRRFLTLLHLTPETLEVDSTGVSETKRNLAKEDFVELSLPVAPGAELVSERIMFSAGKDYHEQLENYGAAVRVLKHARVSGPAMMGWWSWTAYYSRISEGVLRTNMNWLAEHLKKLGYDYFHLDEGYMYARGEYATADAARFPDGMRAIGRAVNRLGLKFGIWTAPFEVTDRSSVYRDHKDWLVKNAAGNPLRLGKEVTGHDTLYSLDTTHPGAQEYLTQMYRTLVRDWGVAYIKLDFMEEAAVEGYRHRPDTTYMEAQQIGLRVIREAVGEDVLLDKDGSPVLNPVGYVDEGRIAMDTAHDFARTKNVAPGIAARYFMHRNYFVSDPDAFCISRQTIAVKGTFPKPLTQSEAEAGIVLSAVSGGMFEIGDDLPTLGADPGRLALVTNPDLIRMVQLSRAARPLDLMSYSAEDGQPSIFWLRESRRQGMLAVFNFTEAARKHKIAYADLGLPAGRTYRATDVLDRRRTVSGTGGAVAIENPPHSVRLIKIIDQAIAPAAPELKMIAPPTGAVGESLKLEATAEGGLTYRWTFGDGTVASGPNQLHAFTRAGEYPVSLTVEGVDGVAAKKTVQIKITGSIQTPFPLSDSRRYQER